MNNLTITMEIPGLTAAIRQLAEALAQTAGGPTRAPAPAVSAPAATAPSAPPAPVQQRPPATPAAPCAYTAPPVMPPAAPTAQPPMPTANAAPSCAPTVPVSAQTVPVAQPPVYTAEQLQVAVGCLMDAGKAPQLQELLHKYQVQRMPDLRPEQLGAFAADLRGLGAQI